MHSEAGPRGRAVVRVSRQVFYLPTRSLLFRPESRVTGVTYVPSLYTYEGGDSLGNHPRPSTNPHDFLKSPKSLPVPEMEKLMLTNIQVKDDDLRALASQRAMNVKDTILKSGKIEPARVFVVEPKSLSPERREKVRDCRVDFRLR